MSSFFLLAPSEAVGSTRLCRITFSCLFSFSLCSTAKDDAKRTTDSSEIAVGVCEDVGSVLLADEELLAIGDVISL